MRSVAIKMMIGLVGLVVLLPLESGAARWTLKTTTCPSPANFGAEGIDSPVWNFHEPASPVTVNPPPAEGPHFSRLEVRKSQVRFQRAVVQNGQLTCQYRFGPKGGSTAQALKTAGRYSLDRSFQPYQCQPGSGFSVSSNGVATCTAQPFDPRGCDAICRRP